MRQNKSKILANFVLIISLISAGITLLFKSATPQGYELLWMLPFLYGFLFYLTNMKRAVLNYVGIALLNIILFGRYLILPSFSAISGTYFHSSAIITMENINRLTILMMLYEMTCIFMIMHYLIKKLDKEKAQNINADMVYDTKYGIYVLVILMGSMSFLILPEIRGHMNFIIPKKFEYSNMNTVSSIAYLFVINVLPALFLLVLSREYNRSWQGYRVRHALLIFVSFLNISLFFGPGRMSVLAQGLATIALLSSLKITTAKGNSLLLFLTILIVVSLSSYRWFGSGKFGVFYSESGEYFTNQMTANTLQAYFGGPHLLSTAVKARENFMAVKDISTFFNEILSSIIFVRQVFPPSDNLSTVIFNHLFGYTRYNSMILPTLGQGYMYFGFLGAPVLSILFCFFLYRAELGAISSRSVGVKYAYYLLAIWLALFPMQNINIIMQTIFNKFLPLYLIVIVNQRVKFNLRSNISQIFGNFIE